MTQNSFGTLDCDTFINTSIDYPISHIIKTMNIQNLGTLHKVCELKRTQLISILAMPAQTSLNAGYLLTENHSNFL